jgi:mono/diheme cytochrome c family protein
MLYRVLIGAGAAFVGLYIILAAVIYLNPATRVTYDKADPHVIDFAYVNGLDGGGRETFYHLSQGSEILPVRWLRAMEDPATNRPFMENLDRFGLLPDPDRRDGLPVGMTLSKPYPVVGEMAGITCAACHVAEFRYNGKGVRVDGAPNMFDMQAFYEAMLNSAQATLDDPRRFDRVLERLVRQDLDRYGPFAPVVRVYFWIEGAGRAAAFRDNLKARIELLKVIRTAISRREANAKPGEVTTSGFGRLDAFNGSRNFLLGRFSEANIVPLAAPVKFPPIWGFKDYEWIEWTQNTNSILERNVTETLGAGATASLDAGPGRFESTVPVRNLHQLETTAYRIQPPAWPSAVFGAPNADAVARGRDVFQTRCAGCHEYGADRRTATGLTQLRTFSPQELGVDPSTAQQVAAPVVNTGDLPLDGSHSFAKAVAYVVNNIRDKAYAREKVTPDEQAEMEDRTRRGGVYWRDTLPDTGKPYAARPLHGVWAMAPYLHNGSVPTLYDLLSPPAMRPRQFAIGQRDFDPKRVGYTTDIPLARAKYVVDTTKPGNANTGHAYGEALTDQQRWDVVEYLKTY